MRGVKHKICLPLRRIINYLTHIDFMKLLKLTALIALLITSCTFVSCSDDDKDNPSQGRCLTGTWEAVYDNSDPFTYIFYSDGSGRAYWGSVGNPTGRINILKDYKVGNGRLYICWDGDDEFDDKGEIKDIAANSFLLRWAEDDPWMTFHKK